MLNLFRLWFVIWLVPLTGISQSYNKVKAQKGLFEQLDNFLQIQIDTAKQSPISGIAIAIVRGKELIHAQSFGVASIKTKRRLKPDDTFHVASISKTFAATAILQLTEKGKLRLEEKITHYLPYFSMADVRYNAITLRQILNHTSGMPDVEDYEWEKG